MLRRSIDLVGALLLLILASPLLAVIAVALRLEGYGPVLYHNEREALRFA
jgi:lipopolysaccharide/colanic/teichoic acid biosynthesis glycosyltransferase